MKKIVFIGFESVYDVRSSFNKQDLVFLTEHDTYLLVKTQVVFNSKVYCLPNQHNIPDIPSFSPPSILDGDGKIYRLYNAQNNSYLDLHDKPCFNIENQPPIRICPVNEYESWDMGSIYSWNDLVLDCQNIFLNYFVFTILNKGCITGEIQLRWRKKSSNIGSVNKYMEATSNGCYYYCWSPSFSGIKPTSLALGLISDQLNSVLISETASAKGVIKKSDFQFSS